MSDDKIVAGLGPIGEAMILTAQAQADLLEETARTHLANKAVMNQITSLNARYAIVLGKSLTLMTRGNGHMALVAHSVAAEIPAATLEGRNAAKPVDTQIAMKNNQPNTIKPPTPG
jgi:hypothetical protein